MAGTRRQNEFIFGHSIGSYPGQSSGRTNVDDTRPDLPFFDLTTVAAATNNFSIENKLGTGGFGSVYKVVSLDRSVDFLSVQVYCLFSFFFSKGLDDITHISFSEVDYLGNKSHPQT